MLLKIAQTFVTAVYEQRSSLQPDIHPIVKVLHTRYFAVDFETGLLYAAILFDDWTNQYPVAYATHRQQVSN